MVHRLENGVTLAMEQLPYLHSASVGIWIRTGSANESDAQAGVAHFLEHLFFKGTKTRSVHEIMEAVEGRGGHLNAFTAREHTCLYVKVLDRHVHIAIEILADLLKNSLFCDLEKERNVVLEEIASIEDTPDEHVHDVLTEFHWPNHPLGRSISGSQASVNALTREDVQHFYDTWYTADNIIVSIAGSFDETAVQAQLEAEFSVLPARETPTLGVGPAFHGGIKHLERDIAQAHVCLAFPAPMRLDEERYTCDLLSSILGGGSTSRLFEQVREEEGLAYAIYACQAYQSMAGMLGVYAAVAPQNFGRMLNLTLTEMRRLCDEPVSADEIETNREQLKGSMLMALESTSTRMARMAKGLMYHGRILPIEEIIARLDAVSSEEIQAFAQKTFVPNQTALVVLGPTGGDLPKEIAL